MQPGGIQSCVQKEDVSCIDNTILSTHDFSQLTLIIPTLNEVCSIGLLLGTLVKSYPGVKIVVADDCSDDGTSQVAKSFQKRHRDSAADEGMSVELLDRRHAATAGITASVLDAVHKCKTPYLIVMDADFQHPPNKVAEIFQLLLGGADIAVGCRESAKENRPFVRGAMSAVSTYLARKYLAQCGTQVSDPLSGFFGAKTSLIRELAEKFAHRFELRGYKVLFDVLKAAPSSLKIAECFYSFGERPYGRSKLRVVHVLYFLRALSR